MSHLRAKRVPVSGMSTFAYVRVAMNQRIQRKLRMFGLETMSVESFESCRIFSDSHVSQAETFGIGKLLIRRDALLKRVPESS